MFDDVKKPRWRKPAGLFHWAWVLRCGALFHGEKGAARLYPTQRRAFWNTRNHGLASAVQAAGVQLICTFLCTRSMCGISTVKRPSGVVTDVIPSGEPFGFNG